MWNASRFPMTIALLIFAMVALVGCAAEPARAPAFKTFQTATGDTIQAALMTDKNGQQYACTTNADCASLMGEDANFGGALCDRYAAGGAACYAVVKNCKQTTDASTGKTSLVCSYPDSDNCVSNEDCDDGNACTADKCVYGMFKDSDVPTGLCNRPAMDPAKGPMLTCGKGICESKVAQCSSLGAYDPNPACVPLSASVTEVCNNLDDNCDGATDEDFTNMGLGEACNVGVGECANSGKKICLENGSGLTCSVSPKSKTDEICDNKDNDCDGNVDEDFVLGAECTSGLGICQMAGKVVCKQDGSAGVCDAVPGQAGTESCNDLDDDCDGNVDEGCDDDKDGYCDKAMAVDGSPKVCSKGSGDCSDTASLIYPNQSEVCNGVDDDCDGNADEDFAGLGSDCTSGVGECAAAGKKVCAGDQMSVVCNGNPKSKADEICDNKDNDCDGVTDNGCDDDKDGYCDAAVTIAQGPTPTVCSKGTGDCDDTVAQIYPNQSEVCNGSDDNCNNEKDEGLSGNVTCGYAACAVTVAKCVNGVAPVCSADLTKSESEDLYGVDGKDNDCNGQIDDGKAAAWCSNPAVITPGGPDVQISYTGLNAQDLVDTWSCPDANGNAVTLSWPNKELLYKVSAAKGKKVTCTLTETSGAGTLMRGILRVSSNTVCEAAPTCQAFAYKTLSWVSDGTATWLVFDGKDKASPYTGTLKCVIQ